MGSEDKSRHRSSRRRRDHDQEPRERAEGKDRDHDRRRSRDRRDRRRSRTPDSSRRRDREGETDRHSRRYRDDEGDRERKRRRSQDRSPKRRKHREELREEEEEAQKSPLKRNGPLPTQEASWAITNGEEPEKPKEKPNYGTTGRLAAASNSIEQADGTSITLKYHEPAEARKPSPKDQWKLYVFKGADILDEINLNARSCWLVGREQAVVDMTAEHPSISKQHAVFQFRYTEKRNEFGDKLGKVKPYLIDLESANGTRLNGERVDDSRYLELRDKDMVQFGSSTREYVLMLAPRG